MLEILKLYEFFKNNNEKLEILNSFQKLVFNQKSAAPQMVPPGARGPQGLHLPLQTKLFLLYKSKVL